MFVRFKLNKLGKDEFITDRPNLIISPITPKALGRYKCTASNPYASTNSFVNIQSMPTEGEIYDSIVYAFIDNEDNKENQVSHLRLSEHADKQVLRIKNKKNHMAINESVNLECYTGKTPKKKYRF